MEIKERQKNDRFEFNIGDLDFDVFVLILSFLNLYEVMKISTLNKHFYELMYFPNGYENDKMRLDRSIRGFSFWKSLAFHQFPLPTKRRLKLYADGMHPKIFLVHQHYKKLALWKLRMDMIINQFEQKLMQTRTTQRHIAKVLFVVPSLWRAQKQLYQINAHFEHNDMRGHPFEKYEHAIDAASQLDGNVNFKAIESSLNQSVHVVVQLRQRYYNSQESRFELSKVQHESILKDFLSVMTWWYEDTKDKWHIGPASLIDSIFGHYLRAHKRYKRHPSRYRLPPISLKCLSRKGQIEGEILNGSRMKYYTRFYLDKYLFLPSES